MRNKKQILKESTIDSLYNTQLILEVLLDIRDLSEPIEPSKPSEEEVNCEQAYNREHVIEKHLAQKMESIRADERRVLREKLLDTELHYKDWSSKEAFFSKEDIYDLLK